MAVIGRRVIESELAGLERRFASHARIINKLGGNSVAAATIRGASRPRISDPMYGPGRKEQLQAIRAREKEEIKSGLRVQKEKLAQERTAARAKESLDRQRSRSLLAHHNAEQRELKRKAQTEIAFQRQAQRENRAFVRSTIGNGASRVMSTVGAVGRVGAAAIGLGGASLAASAVTRTLKLDEASRRLAIAGRGPGQQGADPEHLRRTFTNLGVETGNQPEALAGAAGVYVAKTGDLSTAMANMRNFAIVAQATGASVEDVASAGADLAQKFDIKSAEDMAQALAVLTFQGKKGAFELKDMAEQFPEMAAAAQRAGMTGVGGMKTLGGLAQIARQSTGSGSEASTAVQMMLTQLTTKAAELKSGKALGGERVNVFEGGDATKKARDIPTVLAEVISKSDGNQTEIAKLFDVRGLRAISPLIKTYRDAADSTEGSATVKQEAGRKAVLNEIAKSSETGAGFGEVQRDAADAMKSTSVQLEILNSKLQAAIASSLFPAIMQLVPEIERLVPAVGRIAAEFVNIATAFAQNPIGGIGAVIAASVMKDLAGAGIGQAVNAALGSGIMGMAAAGLISIAALGVGAYQVGQMVVASMLVEAQRSAEGAAKSGDEVRAKALTELQTNGYLSQDTRNDLERLKLTEEGVFTGAEEVGKEGFLGGAGRAFNSLTNTLGFGDGTGTLGEAQKLQATATNEQYVQGAMQTTGLLMLDDSAKKLATGAESVRQALVDGATEAAAKLKEGAGDAKPNRGDGPTGIK